jgi:dipeptide/tripeptide permease
MLNKFLVRVYPFFIAGFVLMMAFEVTMKNVQLRDIVFFAATFLVLVPLWLYPRWKKRQLAPPADRNEPKAQLKTSFIAVGVYLLVAVPLILAILNFTSGATMRIAAFVAGFVAPLIALYLIARFKLLRRE